MISQLLDDNSNPIHAFRPTTTEVVDGTSASTQSGVITARLVRIVASADVNYLVGDNPTATTSTVFLPAKTVELIKLDASDKIAVLGGKLYITILE